jgi:MFS family permease
VTASTPARGFLAANARWLGAGALLAGLSSFGQTFFISVFAGEIRAAHGLSAGAWGLVYTAGTTASAATMLWAGGLVDRVPVRPLATATLLGLAAACLAMAAAPAVWALVLAVFALRLLGQGMTSHVAMVTMARWFHETRGRALSIAGLGFSVGEAALPLLFVAGLGVLGYRPLWVICAGIVALAVIPVRALLARERRPRGRAAQGPEAPGMDGRHWTRAEVLRSELFLAMAPTVVGPSAFVTAFFFLQVDVAEAKGWSHLELVALFPLYTAATVAAMLGAGWAVDRLGSGRLIPLFMLPLAGSFLLLSAAATPLGAAAALSAMGTTQGVTAVLSGALWAEFYGTRHLGAIKAMATALMVLGSAIGPGLTGLLIDAGIPFEAQMPGIAAYFVAASALTALLVGRSIRRLPRRDGR